MGVQHKSGHVAGTDENSLLKEAFKRSRSIMNLLVLINKSRRGKSDKKMNLLHKLTNL